MAYFKCNQIFLIDKTASGAVASFSDGIGGVPFSDLTAQIIPFQDGTGDPSPQNVRTIHGYTGVNVTRTGKNLFDKSNNDIVKSAYIDSSAVYTESGLTRSVVIACKPSTVYTVSKIQSNRFAVAYANETVANNVQLYGYIVNNSATSISITTGAEAKYIVVFCYHSNYDSSLSDIINSLQIELGSIATAYEPYNGTTYAVTWQTEAGTVYCGFIDLTTGLLTVTHGFVTIKDQAGLSFSKSSIETADTYYRNISTWVSDLVVSGYTEIDACDKFKPERSANPNTIFIQNQYLNVRTPVDEYATAADFLTWVQTNGISFVFELATPQTYQLSETEVLVALLGNNNVFSDTGNTEVTYKAKP